MDTNDMYVVIKGPVYVKKRNADGSIQIKRNHLADGSIYCNESPIQNAREQEN
jgi:hypothetical protein